MGHALPLPDSGDKRSLLKLHTKRDELRHYLFQQNNLLKCLTTFAGLRFLVKELAIPDFQDAFE